MFHLIWTVLTVKIKFLTGHKPPILRLHIFNDIIFKQLKLFAPSFSTTFPFHSFLPRLELHFLIAVQP